MLLLFAQVGDKLREMLVNEDSENSAVFSSTEKKELLFHLFAMLCTGGSLCQSDVNISRYLDITKKLYKELLTVYR